jgi:hypothetical protein
MIIPHPEIPIGEIRTLDMVILLALGGLWELVSRFIVVLLVRKPKSLRTKERNYKALQYETNQKRKLGPSAFVETSKLERQVLAEEKALTEIYQNRKATLAQVKKIVKNLNIMLSIAVAFCFYRVPILTVDGTIVETVGDVGILTASQAIEVGAAWTKAFLFPLSYVGFGIRFSKWGLPDPSISVGAVLVMWSAQTTVGMIMDGVEALVG